MTEDEARAVLDGIAAALGDRWATALGDDPSGAIKSHRLEYGRKGQFSMTYCHGHTWAEALEDFVKASGMGIFGDSVPEWLQADSVEELRLRVAAFAPPAESAEKRRAQS